MAKERVNIYDLNRDAPPPAIPTTLEAAEAKGGPSYGRDGPRRMMGGAGGDRDDRGGSHDRRDDMELNFSRGTANQDYRGGGGGEGRMMRSGGDNMEWSSRPGGMREMREYRDNDRDSRYGNRNEAPRNEIPDHEMTFSRGTRRTENNNSDRNYDKLPRRSMMDDRDGGRDGGRDGEFGMRRSRNEDSNTGGGGFTRGTKTMVRGSRMGDPDAEVMKRQHNDGLTFLQRRQKAQEEATKKAEEDRILAENKRREQEETERVKKAEAEAAEKAKATAKADEELAPPKETVAFATPSFRRKELVVLSETIWSALSDDDKTELETLCESLNHDIYNAPGCFLLPFIIQSFKFGFDQKGKMSTEEYVGVLVKVLEAMKSLFDRCQLDSVTVDKRIIWNVLELNRIYSGAGLNDKCHLADALLQAFVASGFLSSNTLKLWFEMQLNNDEETPKTATQLFRTSLKNLTIVCKNL